MLYSGVSGRRTVAAGAAVLAISERQAYRLLARYESGGGADLIHRARGQTSNRSVNGGIRNYVVELVKTRLRSMSCESEHFGVKTCSV